MKNIYVVMGGLGKNILFTSLIPSLCKRDEVDQISIIAHWPHVFTSNEQVDQVWPPPDWKHEPILEQYDNVIYHEPYLSNYIKDKNMHIVNDWANAFSIPLVDPKPYIKHTYENENDYSLSEPLTKSKYCVVQVNGGNEVYGKNVNSPRDYRLDLVQKLIFRIRKHLDLDVVCFRLESEPKPSDTITFESKSEKGVLGILPLIENAEFVVSIDSALMHFSACTDKGKKTIVLWNTSQTSPERIGYNFQTNLTCNNNIAIDIDPTLIMEKIVE